MKKVWLGLIGLLLLGSGLAGTYFLARRPNPTTTPTTPQPSTSATATPTPATSSAVIIPTQTIQDSAGLYSLQLPDNWQVKLEAAKGIRISDLLAQSPDYKVKIDTEAEGPFTPIYYQAGASLQVTVLQQPLADNPQPAGTISEQRAIQVDGVEGTYFAFKEPSTAEGQLLEVRLEKSSRSYQLRLGFNPESLDGQEIFAQIVSSFRFLP